MKPRAIADRQAGQPRSATSGLVYSTDSGRMCPECRKPIAQCACKRGQGEWIAGQARNDSARDGVVRVSRETKGRGGKAVTVVRGLALDAASLVKLAQQLKAACGSGGTVKDGAIEVQGDHCDKVIALLEAQGHTVKRAGG
jgi:translation initiation factor 1